MAYCQAAGAFCLSWLCASLFLAAAEVDDGSAGLASDVSAFFMPRRLDIASPAGMVEHIKRMKGAEIFAISYAACFVTGFIVIISMLAFARPAHESFDADEDLYDTSDFSEDDEEEGKEKKSKKAKSTGTATPRDDNARTIMLVPMASQGPGPTTTYPSFVPPASFSSFAMR